MNKEDDLLSISSNDSDYSLDYEYIGPRQPNYRNEHDPDSDCSELSDSPCHNGFDMWDEDLHSTNEFTWESNEMKLTNFIKTRKGDLDYWKNSSFYHKAKGWPLQLPFSCSTANHDQSADSLCLIMSDYGISEKLHSIYRDKIIECGISFNHSQHTDRQDHEWDESDTTWLESDQSSSSRPLFKPSSSLFHETHVSISLPQPSSLPQQTACSNLPVNSNLLSKFIPYTKYIKRSEIPTVHTQLVYLSLSFEPLCLEEKYGFMTIGGLEGEFEVYCCMEQQPNKIWETKFKGKNNVLLMTNSMQIVRVPKGREIIHLLIVCVNDAGILIYELSKHSDCHSVSLLHHIRSFDHVPINDAKLSPDGRHLICVGDDACVFHLTLGYDSADRFTFTGPKRMNIFKTLLSTNTCFYSSQHVSWSKSSLYFAHTSDSHNFVLVWSTYPKLKMLYSINAGGNTFAVQFHPEHEGVLAFTNRYGYLHTVDLDEAISSRDPHQPVSITKISSDNEDSVCQTMNLIARQEVTMVSFRGEKNKRLRILAKINGIKWSKDGRYLYVSTKKRVLAYMFIRSYTKVDTLEKIATEKVLSALENQAKKRRRGNTEWTKNQRRALSKLPECLQEKIMKNTSLASH